MADDMLAISEHLPEIDLAPGDVLVREGGIAESLWILVSGALRVLKGDVVLNTINQPGAVIGEMSLLLAARHSATVEAIEPSRVRFAANGHALLDGNPTFTKLVAIGLAERLAYVTTYLADLTRQYGDSPGLTMVSSVLSELEQHKATRAQPGSIREPDPEY
jgi:CRP/FNR family transcriptional regulator, cyclic AMP receptor protein